MKFVWPIIVIEDRYSGVYSGGEYTAWNMYPHDIPKEIFGDDIECPDFFSKPDLIYGRGETPQEAIDDLKYMINHGAHMPTKKKEEKEMGVKFDHYIKNVKAIDVEMLPDDSQVTFQVRTEEDIHLFLLEGKGVKIAADRYTELKAENFQLKREKTKEDEEMESLLEKYKEQEAKIADLQIEKARLKQEKKRILEEQNQMRSNLLTEIDDISDRKKVLEQVKDDLIQKNKNLVHDLGLKKAECQSLKADFDNLRKSIDAKNWGLCDKFKAAKDECNLLKKENYELTMEKRNQSKEIDKLKKKNKHLNRMVDDMVLNTYNNCRVRLHGMDFTMDELVDRILELEETSKELNSLKLENGNLEEKVNILLKELERIIVEKKKLQYLKDLKTPTIKNFTDEEPHSRRDILRCAEKCVCGKREQDYGTPESNFKIIADLWNDYLGLAENGDGVPIFSIKNITPTDVAMMMALLKIARIRNGGGTGDSFVDLAGYAACGGEINAQKKATKTN